jgi:hypothetical protein
MNGSRKKLHASLPFLEIRAFTTRLSALPYTEIADVARGLAPYAAGPD